MVRKHLLLVVQVGVRAKVVGEVTSSRSGAAFHHS